MKRARIVKTSICLTAAALITINAQFAKAATNEETDTALAGITLSLDRYYDATVEQSLDKLASVDSVSAQALRSAIIEDTESVEQDSADSSETETSETLDSTAEVVSPYENIGISIASDYVNIRNKPNEESEVLGKLYKGSSADILDIDGEWVKVKSGSVEGYIMASYLAIGKEAEKVADQYGTKLATVTTTTLKVREKKSQDSTVLTLVPEGETYQVIKEYDNWVKILIDSDLKGYVSKDYVEVSIKFDKAISVEEELAQIAKEEEEKHQAEEAKKAEEARKTEQVQQSSQSSSSSSSSSSSNSSSSNGSSSSSSSSSSDNSSSSSSSSNSSSSSSNASGTAAEVIAYAKQFLGNRYVYGGTSLTNGTDCSGFTMSVFAHFGYSIPRVSRDQANAGVSVSLDNVQPGDLVFYTGSNGSVNHVALYIGGGQVIHASNPTNGILISNWKYRSPYKVRRIIQ
jgi:cell wall-associated NlpC family hydrolase